MDEVRFVGDTASGAVARVGLRLTETLARSARAPLLEGPQGVKKPAGRWIPPPVALDKGATPAGSGGCMVLAGRG